MAPIAFYTGGDGREVLPSTDTTPRVDETGCYTHFARSFAGERNAYCVQTISEMIDQLRLRPVGTIPTFYFVGHGDSGGQFALQMNSEGSGWTIHACPSVMFLTLTMLREA